MFVLVAPADERGVRHAHYGAVTREHTPASATGTGWHAVARDAAGGVGGVGKG